MDVGGLRGRTPAASTVPEVDDGREARLARPGQMSAYPDPQELGTTRTVFKKQKRAWNTWEPDASLEVVATNQPIANRFDGSKNEAARVPLERESERLRLEATAVLDEQAELDEQRRILAPEKLQPPPSSSSSAGAAGEEEEEEEEEEKEEKVGELWLEVLDAVDDVDAILLSSWGCNDEVGGGEPQPPPPPPAAAFPSVPPSPSPNRVASSRKVICMCSWWDELGDACGGQYSEKFHTEQ